MMEEVFIMPASFAQQRLWFLDQMEPGAATYNIRAAIRLAGDLDTDLLARSLAEVVRRHEALRTTFDMGEEHLTQIIHPEMPLPLPVLNLEETPEREAESRRLASAEAQRPFDLRQGPLLRTTLLRMGEREHIFLLTVHHIICDGWSVGVLVSELGALYAAAADGREADLPELPVQYGDYAVWQRQQSEAGAMDAHLDYWRGQLADAPGLLALPTDRPRPAVQSFTGAVQTLAWSAELSAGLRELSRANGATLYMTLLAGFQALLHRYTGEGDIVVGTPVAGRTRAEVEGLIGMFVNTLAIRSDLSEDPTFRELLARVREASLDAYAHQEAPFERVVEAAQPERALSHAPLFQVMFVFQNEPLPEIELPRLRMTPVDVEFETAKFDMTLTVIEATDGLKARLTYNTELFDAETAGRMLRHLTVLLEAMVADPDARVSSPSLLSAPERERAVVEWNSTQTTYPRDLCFQQLFEAQVERTPHATALIYEDEQLTYRELNARANRLAHQLRGLGVGPDVIVAVCVERSVEMLVGLLGVLKAGGAYLPLSYELPPERMGMAIEDSRARVILTQRRWLERLPAGEAKLVFLDDDPAEIAHLSTENPVSRTQPDNLAYVIYTSGSTGAPKGVLVEQRNMVNYLSWAGAHLFGARVDVIPVVTEFTFDPVLKQLFVPLLRGGVVWMISREMVGDPVALLRAIGRRARVGLNCVPALWRAMLDAMEEDAGLIPAGSLTSVLLGGDRLRAELVERTRRLLPQVEVWNLYGPTETTVNSAAGVIDDAAAEITIGRPVANTQLYVLDGRLQLTPVGMSGELYIAGDGVARGYLNSPHLTAERFLPDPYARAPGGRMYRTGDLVRYRADGRVVFLGRNDRQVKVHGYRIELREIERALEGHAAVKESVVVTHEGAQREQRLVAYVTPSGRGGLKPEELRGYLKSKLPGYAVPGVIVVLERMPLTAHGKPDLQALPAPEQPTQTRDAAFVAPRTPAEQILAGIWGDVLRLPRVGVHDNFFELGGDSILSIQIVARARQAGLKLTPRQLFQHQNVAELAAAAESDDSPATAGGQEPVTGDVPLTPIQRRFFEQDAAEPHHFNQSVLLTTREPLDPELLRAVTKQLLAHHDALRLRFVREADGWRQFHADAVDDVPFTSVDLSALPEDEHASRIETVASELQSSLDLAAGPLLRVALFERGAGRSGRLLIVIHHLVIDGVSWRVLLEDLQTGYRQLSQGEALRLPPKTTSFKHWAERLTEVAQSDAMRRELDYWQTAARARQSAPLPSDYPGGAGTVATALTVTASLDSADTRSLLQEVPEVYHTQIADVLLTALAQTFAGWSGAPSLLLDLEGHGREEIADGVDLSRTVGWLTAVYPVSLVLEADDSPGAALKGVKEQLRRVPTRGVGYGLLRYLCRDRNVGAELAALPQPQVLFNYLGQFDQALSESSPFGAASESSGATRSPRAARAHLFEINAHIADGKLQVAWSYSTQAHARATVERLAQTFVAKLRALITHCRAADAGGYTPSDFPLARLDQRTLDQIVGSDRRVEDIYPLSPTQEVMLFHTLGSPRSQVGMEQLSWTFNGRLNVAAFEQAWQWVVARHTALRTAFVWQNLAAPLQVVRPRASVPLLRNDWRGRTAGERRAEVDAYLAADLHRGFDLTAAPLMRLTLSRLTETAYHCAWTHHHLLMDGWCLPVVLNEVFTAYEAFDRDAEPGFAPSYPYRNYIAWLRRQDAAAAEAFWRREMEGFTTPTPLPADLWLRAAPGEEESYAELLCELPQSLQDALAAVARRHHLTLSSVMHGAWALLLGRYCGEAETVFGVTVSGRPADLTGVEAMIGMFINILPLRVAVSGGEELLPWLRRLQEHEAHLRQYEHTALAQVHEWSEVPRGERLFESIVVVQNYPLDESLYERSEHLKISDVRSGVRTNYPLSLIVNTNPQLSFRLIYDRRRFQPATADALLSHLRSLLESIALDPERRLAELPLLDGAARQKLLTRWDGAAAADGAAHPPSVHQLFETQVGRSPESVALSFEGRALTYRQLDAEANRLAHYLSARGVGRETKVGICLRNTANVVVASLGVLKAGGACVPLDPGGRAQLEAALDGGGLHVIVTERKLSHLLAPSAARLVELDAEADAIAAESEAAPVAPLSPANLAFVKYQSAPGGAASAGAQTSHDAAVNVLRSLSARLRLTAADAFLCVATFSADAAPLEFLLPLCAGARLVLVTSRAVSDVSRLAEIMEREGVSVMRATPAEWALLLAAGWGGHERLRVLCDGATLSPALAAQLAARAAAVWMLYGVGEAAAWSVAQQVGAMAAADARVAWQDPLTGAQLYVLDEHLQLAPAGVTGTLHVGGRGLARGYAGRPELTAERFIPHPFSLTPGARLFKTETLARYLPDGRIECLGGRTQQARVRGRRAVAGEIESALRHHPAVHEAVVVFDERVAHEPRVVAYVAPDSGDASSPRELRRYLMERLPEHARPSIIMALDALPLTADGKVSRAALPAPTSAGAEAGAGDESPMTPTEEVLAGIWCELLGAERVGAQDNFFDLGGHSLLATQAITRVREAFHVELPLSCLFEAPDVASLAAMIDQELRADQASPASAIGRAPRDGALPLSFGQQRLWFIDQLRPGDLTYLSPAALRLKGSLNVGALELTLNALAERHEVLRTTFKSIDGRPAQVIAPSVELKLSLVPLDHLSAREQEAEAARLIDAELRTPFDLARGPMLRATLLRLREDEHVLLFTTHHIATDGWSKGVMTREVAALYRAFVSGEPARLPALPIQYADYAHWQHLWLQSEAGAAQLAYWKERLGGALPQLRLPLDRPRPASPTSKGGGHSHLFDAALTEQLKHLSRREGATLYMTLLAAFNVLLNYYTGQTDILVGSDIANRNRSELEGLIGYFSNMLVMRNDLSGQPTFVGLLSRVRAVALGAYAHQDVPFDRLVEELRPERELGRMPLIQVVFVLQSTPLEPLALPDLTLTPHDLGSASATFDMTWNISETSDGLRAWLTFNEDLFDASSVARMTDDFELLLARVVAEPSSTLDALQSALARAHERRRAGEEEGFAAARRRFKSARRRSVARG